MYPTSSTRSSTNTEPTPESEATKTPSDELIFGNVRHVVYNLMRHQWAGAGVAVVVPLRGSLRHLAGVPGILRHLDRLKRALAASKNWDLYVGTDGFADVALHNGSAALTPVLSKRRQSLGYYVQGGPRACSTFSGSSWRATASAFAVNCASASLPFHKPSIC